MANYDRNAKPYSKPFPVQIHYTAEELDALEKGAREIRRMDWTDKVKLIQGNRMALELEGTLAEREAWFEKCIAMWKQEEVMWKERETELLATLDMKWAGTKPE